MTEFSHIDNKTGKAEGPFRLSIKKYEDYQGSTKDHSFSASIKSEVLKRSNGRCELCGHKGKLEIDHIYPKEKGGQSTFKNACALCSRCNDSKCNKDPNQFLKEKQDQLINWASIIEGAKP